MTNDSIKESAIKAENEQRWFDAALLYDKLNTLEESKLLLSKSGWCYSRASEYSLAIERFKKLALMEPESAKTLYMIGYQYYSQKNWKEAREWFEKAISIFPNYFVVKYRLGYTYLQLAGNYKSLTKPEFWRAIGQFQECHELWKDYSSEEKTKNKVLYADICFQHGKALLQLNQRINEAIDLFKSALQIQTNDDYLYELAKAYSLNNQKELALQTLPNSNKYYVNELRCQIKFDLNNFESALSDLLNIINTRKKDYLFILLSKIYEKMDRNRDAYFACMDGLKYSKDNHKLYFQLAKICFNLKKYFEAKNYIDLAIKIRENNFHLDYPEALKLSELINIQLANHKIDDKNILQREFEKGIRIGYICTYKIEKGFGFIKSDDSEFFFHISKCNYKEIVCGDKVEFEIASSEKGLTAINIKKYKNT